MCFYLPICDEITRETEFYFSNITNVRPICVAVAKQAGILNPIYPSGSQLAFLSYEICLHLLFRLRIWNTCRFSCFDAFEHPRHILADTAHDLQAFQVLPHLFRCIAMYHVPVVGGDNRHPRYGEIFVECVQRRSSSGTSRGSHRCPRLECKGTARRIEQPV